MKTQLHLTGDAKTLDALARFLGALETLTPTPMTPPKAICGEDNVIYVEVGYRTDEETFVVGDYMPRGRPDCGGDRYSRGAGAFRRWGAYTE